MSDPLSTAIGILKSDLALYSNLYDEALNADKAPEDAAVMEIVISVLGRALSDLQWRQQQNGGSQ